MVDLLFFGVFAEIRKVAHDLVVIGEDVVTQRGIAVVLWHLREALRRDADGSGDEELVFDALPVVLYCKLAHIALALLCLGRRDLNALHVLERRDSVIDYFRRWFPAVEVEACSRQRGLDDVCVRLLHFSKMLSQ